MSIDALVASEFYTVPLDGPVRLWLTLRTNASAVARDGEPVAPRADFMNMLAFPGGEPVFNLPDGVTADSAQWGVADNR